MATETARQEDTGGGTWGKHEKNQNYFQKLSSTEFVHISSRTEEDTS